MTLAAFSDVDVNSRWRMTRIHGHQLWVVQSRITGKYLKEQGSFIAVGSVQAAKALIKRLTTE